MEYSFGDRIRALRKKKGWNQDQLAERSGLSRITIAKCETDSKKRPAATTVTALADALGVTVDYLMQGSELLPNAYPAENLVAVRVLGSVRCGRGGLASTEYDGYELADVRNPDEYFWLRVTGSSMEPEIYAGQLALVHKQNDVESSELAVVVIGDDEGTLKKVIKRDGQIILQAFNPKVEPRVFSAGDLDQLHIIGRVVETKRKW